MNFLTKSPKNQGFSLMELMIVIAIVGVLASIAIPGYKNMLNKAKIIEVKTLMHKVKLAANDYALYHNGKLSNVSNEALQLTHLTDGAKYVQSIIINPESAHVIHAEVSLKQNLGELTYAGEYLIDSGRINWSCHYDKTNQISAYAPKNCTSKTA